MFGLKTNNVRRGRGSVLCDTNKGLIQVKVLEISEDRLHFEYEMKDFIAQNSNIKTDQYLLTLSGSYIAEYDNKKYIAKKWYDSNELNIRDQGELYLSTKKLAQMHEVLKEVPASYITKQIHVSKELPPLLRKRTTEMKKVRSYIRKKGSWSDFELLYLKNFEHFYEQAIIAEKLLTQMDYDRLNVQGDNTDSICHGSYNQHNILISGQDLSIVGFDKCGIGLQIQDLYIFLRKVLEKNNWNLELGSKLIKSYNEEKQITEEEKKILYILFMFPEKYWKIANFYYNAGKAWISKRSQEKLNTIVEQKELRSNFLNLLADFCSIQN